MYLGKYRKQTNHVIKRYEQWQLQISKYSALHKKTGKQQTDVPHFPARIYQPTRWWYLYRLLKRSVILFCRSVTGRLERLICK